MVKSMNTASGRKAGRLLQGGLAAVGNHRFMALAFEQKCHRERGVIAIIDNQNAHWRYGGRHHGLPSEMKARR
jgi:hypothetical protein